MGAEVIFVSHASEDKGVIARPLAKELRARGFTVWYDEYVLTIGDSLRSEIDRGLAECDFGVVILSHAFFAKQWAQRELDGLFARETTNSSARKIVLPVWHNLTIEDVKNHSPTLADRVAVRTTSGLESVVDEICRAVLNNRRPRTVGDVLTGVTIASPYQPDRGLSPGAVNCLQNFVKEWEETGSLTLKGELESVDESPLPIVKADDLVFLFASHGMGNTRIEIKNSRTNHLGMLRAPRRVYDRDYSLALIHFLCEMGLWDDDLCSVRVIETDWSSKSIRVQAPALTHLLKDQL